MPVKRAVLLRAWFSVREAQPVPRSVGYWGQRGQGRDCDEGILEREAELSKDENNLFTALNVEFPGTAAAFLVSRIRNLNL
ncbi:hypothetical protein WISP_120253 [Willisornis vidua]|uniref:Uncharacterized protein n=1 Tax=Willisornis vidua TaxID=1566151 RepID=A0ABQ9CXK8_9PASS|nr:hypothetical protein WISP_120253 [Willisornis vidua]